MAGSRNPGRNCVVFWTLFWATFSELRPCSLVSCGIYDLGGSERGLGVWPHLISNSDAKCKNFGRLNIWNDSSSHKITNNNVSLQRVVLQIQTAQPPRPAARSARNWPTADRRRRRRRLPWRCRLNIKIHIISAMSAWKSTQIYPFCNYLNEIKWKELKCI